MSFLLCSKRRTGRGLTPSTPGKSTCLRCRIWPSGKEHHSSLQHSQTRSSFTPTSHPRHSLLLVKLLRRS